MAATAEGETTKENGKAPETEMVESGGTCWIFGVLALVGAVSAFLLNPNFLEDLKPKEPVVEVKLVEHITNAEAFPTTAAPIKAKHPIQTLSVVLPCANEDDFVMRTVQSVFESVPEDQLEEILVVDDASHRSISRVLKHDFLRAHKTRVLRQVKSQGLIRSKKRGGNAAKGDVIVFLDCHVKPMENWTVPIFKNLRENPRRVVVPLITPLDPETWEETATIGGSKMCLTWNADFHWCNWYQSKYVPILSGGILAISRFWWEATGGYDERMVAWGGENLDQSLRTWLCGGEIVAAEESRVAHMWRDPNKPETQLRYTIPSTAVRRNRLRAAQFWLGPWIKKVMSFPEFEDFKEGTLEIGDLDNIAAIARNLKCKAFDSYIDRFQDLYFGTGLIPKSTFHFREKSTGLCLALDLNPKGPTPDDLKPFVLAPCNARTEMQRFHAANMKLDGSGCCSGFSIWNWATCLAMYEPRGGVYAQACEPDGGVPAQLISLKDGLLVWEEDSKYCLGPQVGVPSDAIEETSKQKDPKVSFSTSCEPRVKELDSEEGFLIVLEQEDGPELCLTWHDILNDLGEEQHMRFLPCKDKRGFFRFELGYQHPDGRHQVQLKKLFKKCLDADSGRFLSVVPCEDEEKARKLNQLFTVEEGKALGWNTAGFGAEMNIDWCADKFVEGNTAEIELTPCELAAEKASEATPVQWSEEAALYEAPRDGQGWIRDPVLSEGLDSKGKEWFRLKEASPIGEVSRCLTHQRTSSGNVDLRMKPCETDRPSQWWTHNAHRSDGKIYSRLESYDGKCLDAGGTQIFMTPCSHAEIDLLAQRWIISRNGWVQAPLYWYDNGREKLPARCLDYRAPKARRVSGLSCDAAREAGFSWEQIWDEIPQETRIYHEVKGTSPDSDEL